MILKESKKKRSNTNKKNDYPHTLATVLVLTALVFTSCGGGDDELTEPADKTNPVVAFENFEKYAEGADGIENDFKGKITATDANGTEGLSVTGGGKVAYIDGNGNFELKDLPTGNHVVTGQAEDPTGNEGKTTQNVTVDMPNQAPSITSFTPVDFMENNVTDVDAEGAAVLNINTPEGTVVGNGTFEDPEGATITIVSSNPKFAAEITGAGTYQVKTTAALTAQDLDFELATVVSHAITLTANDGELDSAPVSGSTKVLDADEFLQYVDRADVTYRKTPVLGGSLETEDLSTLDNANTKWAEKEMDLADSNQTAQNIQKLIRTNTDANPDTVEWVDKDTAIAEVANSGLSDATSLNVASSYISDLVGVGEFIETTGAEAAANNGAYFKNRHGEIVNRDGLKRGIQSVMDSYGVGNSEFFNAPAGYTDAAERRVSRQTRAWLLEMGKMMQQPGANQEANLVERAALAQARMASMTDIELRAMVLESGYGGNEVAFTAFWGS